MTFIISRQFLSRFVDMVVSYNYMLSLVKKKMEGLVATPTVYRPLSDIRLHRPLKMTRKMC